MPFTFTLPTTSAFSFDSSFTCESHPSLPISTSARRGVVRGVLKKHKRLPLSSQSPSLSTVVSCINDYLPYLLAIDAGLGRKTIHNEEINVILRTAPIIEWRPTLSDAVLIAGSKTLRRIKMSSLEYEISFVLATLANTYSLLARVALQPLYVTSTAPLGKQERQATVTTAIKYLLDSASIYEYLAGRAEGLGGSAPCAEVTPTSIRAQRALALAEATLLAVLKDDPYPAIVAQDRNDNDKEWMYKAPDITQVRAHLFARLCLAASEHASTAYSLCHHSVGRADSRLADSLVRYLGNLRRSSRARACRFLAIDAELNGQTGTAIGYLQAALQELEVDLQDVNPQPSGFGRLKKEWKAKREDRKVEKGANWGANAGRLEEIRVVEMLLEKWTKQNDTMFTQAIPPTGPLLAQMPTGREIHTVKPFVPPILDADVLEAMRAPPDRTDLVEGGVVSSGDEDDEDVDGSESVSGVARPGAFPHERSASRAAAPTNYF